MNDKDFEKIYNESDKFEQANKKRHPSRIRLKPGMSWTQLVQKTKMLYVEILYGIGRKVIKT